jgi:PTS system mannose-specific IIA component
MITQTTSKPAVGVVLLGHGRSASELLAAAEGIVGPEMVAGIRAVDAGRGETPKLGRELCDVLDEADTGAGVLVLVDLWGASPCSCAQREAQDHCAVILSGLNLAMLLKVAALDRHELSPQALAHACADSGRRAVQVVEMSPPAVREAVGPANQPSNPPGEPAEHEAERKESRA